MREFRVIPWAALVALMACGEEAVAPTPMDVIEPDAAYVELWQAKVECAGEEAVQTDISRVTFYLIPTDGQNTECPGFACWLPGRIWIRAGREDHYGVVAHEMLHEITQSREHGPLFMECPPS